MNNQAISKQVGNIVRDLMLKYPNTTQQDFIYWPSGEDKSTNEANAKRLLKYSDDDSRISSVTAAMRQQGFVFHKVAFTLGVIQRP